jgi:hypothetical protein
MIATCKYHLSPLILGCLLWPLGASADIAVCTDPTYCGTDGAFNPPVTATIDLSLAASLCDCDEGGQLDDECRWDCPSPVPGQGVYDPEQWAVVFKYSSVNIPGPVTISFANHPTGAPVVWLVDGSVLIDGFVILNGTHGNTPSAFVHSASGPGGFRGGGGGTSSRSAGLGPGGASRAGDPQRGGSGGSYGTAGGSASGSSSGVPYGNAVVLPLIGGSGGAGCYNPQGGSNGGGGGGGALLLATNSSITLNGQIQARGGSSSNTGGGGSGGGIRLIADVVTGPGLLRAEGGTSPGSGTAGTGKAGGSGRIRVEADPAGLIDDGLPTASFALPTDPVSIWPSATSPKVTVVSLGGAPISTSAPSGIDFPQQTIFMADSGAVTLVIEATNVPLTATVTARVVPKTGLDFSVVATFESGDVTSSMWEAQIDVPGNISAIQVRAELP